MFALCEKLGRSPMDIKEDTIPYVKRWLFWQLIKTNEDILKMFLRYFDIADVLLDEEKKQGNRSDSSDSEREIKSDSEKADKRRKNVNDEVMNEKMGSMPFLKKSHFSVSKKESLTWKISIWSFGDKLNAVRKKQTENLKEKNKSVG